MTPVESERKGLVERLPELLKIAEAATPGPWAYEIGVDRSGEWIKSLTVPVNESSHSHIVVGEKRDEFDTEWRVDLSDDDAAYIATFDPPTVLALLDLLSSDARPAPMAEEVKAALALIARRVDPGDLPRSWADTDAEAAVGLVSAYIDDLTRKVAEAEGEIKWLRRGIDKLRSRPQETDAVLAEREACARIVEADRSPDSCPFGPNRGDVRTWALTEDDPCPVCGQTGKDDGSKCRSFARNRVAAAIRSRPSPGPATETDRKDGWWVTPEWRANGGIDRDLWLNEARVGGVYKQPSGWHFYRSGNNNDSTQFATIEEAQAALVLAVRPKDTAPPSDAYPTTVSDFCEVATEALQRILDRCETPRFNSLHWEAHGEAIEDWLDPIRKEATAAQAALLASVRPKEEGV